MIWTVSLTTLSGNTRFKVPIRIWFEEPLCTKPSYCWAPEFSDPGSGHATHEMTETVARLQSSCCLLVSKTLEKSPQLSRHSFFKQANKSVYAVSLHSVSALWCPPCPPQQMLRVPALIDWTSESFLSVNVQNLFWKEAWSFNPSMWSLYLFRNLKKIF